MPQIEVKDKDLGLGGQIASSLSGLLSSIPGLDRIFAGRQELASRIRDEKNDIFTLGENIDSLVKKGKLREEELPGRFKVALRAWRSKRKGDIVKGLIEKGAITEDEIRDTPFYGYLQSSDIFKETRPVSAKDLIVAPLRGVAKALPFVDASRLFEEPPQRQSIIFAELAGRIPAEAVSWLFFWATAGKLGGAIASGLARRLGNAKLFRPLLSAIAQRAGRLEPAFEKVAKAPLKGKTVAERLGIPPELNQAIVASVARAATEDSLALTAMTLERMVREEGRELNAETLKDALKEGLIAVPFSIPFALGRSPSALKVLDKEAKKIVDEIPQEVLEEAAKEAKTAVSGVSPEAVKPKTGKTIKAEPKKPKEVEVPKEAEPKKPEVKPEELKAKEPQQGHLSTPPEEAPVGKEPSRGSFLTVEQKGLKRTPEGKLTSDEETRALSFMLYDALIKRRRDFKIKNDTRYEAIKKAKKRITKAIERDVKAGKLSREKFTETLKNLRQRLFSEAEKRGVFKEAETEADKEFLFHTWLLKNYGRLIEDKTINVEDIAPILKKVSFSKEAPSIEEVTAKAPPETPPAPAPAPKKEEVPAPAPAPAPKKTPEIKEVKTPEEALSEIARVHPDKVSKEPVDLIQVAGKKDKKGRRIVAVVTVNKEGIHGAGLARIASDKGLIKRGQNRGIDESPYLKDKTPVVTIAVKGEEPSTRIKVNRAFTERVTGKNLELVKRELDKLVEIAKKNPDDVFALPLVGMGHGEGDVAQLARILSETLSKADNIVLVRPPKNLKAKYPSAFREGTVRGGKKTQSPDEIKAFLTGEKKEVPASQEKAQPSTKPKTEKPKAEEQDEIKKFLTEEETPAPKAKEAPEDEITRFLTEEEAPQGAPSREDDIVAFLRGEKELPSKREELKVPKAKIEEKTVKERKDVPASLDAIDVDDIVVLARKDPKRGVEIVGIGRGGDVKEVLKKRERRGGELPEETRAQVERAEIFSPAETIEETEKISLRLRNPFTLKEVKRSSVGKNEVIWIVDSKRGALRGALGVGSEAKFTTAEAKDVIAKSVALFKKRTPETKSLKPLPEDKILEIVRTKDSALEKRFGEAFKGFSAKKAEIRGISKKELPRLIEDKNVRFVGIDSSGKVRYVNIPGTKTFTTLRGRRIGEISPEKPLRSNELIIAINRETGEIIGASGVGTKAKIPSPGVILSNVSDKVGLKAKVRTVGGWFRDAFGGERDVRPNAFFVVKSAGRSPEEVFIRRAVYNPDTDEAILQILREKGGKIVVEERRITPLNILKLEEFSKSREVVFPSSKESPVVKEFIPDEEKAQAELLRRVEETKKKLAQKAVMVRLPDGTLLKGVVEDVSPVGNVVLRSGKTERLIPLSVFEKSTWSETTKGAVEELSLHAVDALRKELRDIFDRAEELEQFLKGVPEAPRGEEPVVDVIAKLRERGFTGEELISKVGSIEGEVLKTFTRRGFVTDEEISNAISAISKRDPSLGSVLEEMFFKAEDVAQTFDSVIDRTVSEELGNILSGFPRSEKPLKTADDVSKELRRMAEFAFRKLFSFPEKLEKEETRRIAKWYLDELSKEGDISEVRQWMVSKIKEAILSDPYGKKLANELKRLADDAKFDESVEFFMGIIPFNFNFFKKPLTFRKKRVLHVGGKTTITVSQNPVVDFLLDARRGITRSIIRGFKKPFFEAQVNPELAVPKKTLDAIDELTEAMSKHLLSIIKHDFLSLPQESQQKVGHVLIRGTLRKKVWTEAELKSFGLTPEEIKGYKSVRRMFEEVPKWIDRLADEFPIDAELKKEVKQALEGLFKLEGYFPLMRFGKYGIALQKEQGGKWTTVYYEMTDSIIEAGEIKRELERLYGSKGNYRIREIQRDELTEAQRADLVAFGPTISILKRRGVDPATIDGITSILGEEYLRQLASGRFMRRRAVAGFSRDIRRILETYIAQISSSFPKRFGKPLLEKQIAEIKDPATKNFARDLMKYYFGEITPVGGEGELLRALRRGTSLFYLAFKPFFAVLNLSQRAVLTFPASMKYTKNVIEALGANARAQALELRYLEERIAGASPDAALLRLPLSPQAKRALLEARDRGLLGEKFFEEIIGGVGTKVDRVAGVFGWASEASNRLHAALTAIQIAERQGVKTSKELLDFIRTFVKETQGEFGKLGRAKFERGIGLPIMALRSYTLHYYNWLWANAKEGNVFPVAASVAIAGLLGGLSRLPFLGHLWQAGEAYLKYFRPNDMLKAEEFKQQLQDSPLGGVIFEGLPSLLGISGLSFAFPTLAESDDSFGEALFGPTWSMLRSIGAAGNLLGRLFLYRYMGIPVAIPWPGIAKRHFPPFVKNMLRSIERYPLDIYGNPVITLEDVRRMPREIRGDAIKLWRKSKELAKSQPRFSLKQFLGALPSDKARIYDIIFALENAKRREVSLKKDLNALVAYAIFYDDRDMFKRAIEMSRRFNIRLDIDSIKRRLREGMEKEEIFGAP